MNAQLAMPRRQSNSQIHTVMDAITGIAQASSMAIWRMSRVTLPTAFISRATSTPTTRVTAALTRQNAIERPTTAQVWGSVNSLSVVVQPHELRRLAELLGEPELLGGGHELPDQRVAEGEQQDGDRRARAAGRGDRRAAAAWGAAPESAAGAACVRAGEDSTVIAGILSEGGCLRESAVFAQSGECANPGCGEAIGRDRREPRMARPAVAHSARGLGRNSAPGPRLTWR